MKGIFLFLAPLLFVLHSCKNHDENKGGMMAADADPAHYYAQYTGTIGSRPITMNLVKFAGGYSINYVAADRGTVAELRFQKDSLLKNDSLFFTGSDALRKGMYAPENEDQFHLVLNAGTIAGSWISGDKKTSLPVLLKRGNNYVAFSPLVYIDSLKSDGFQKDTP
ncbi:MAG: hypothetical protein J7539_17170, partial [Niabella sp.]|nr:hypothetical protein [Niabella sp.]